eukprot:13132747-Ditylum_brightwellii.AAC.1
MSSQFNANDIENLQNKNNTTVYSQNVNDLYSRSVGDKMLEKVTTLKEAGVSYDNFIETCLNWTKNNTYNNIKTKLNKVWKHNKLVTSNFKQFTDMTAQPGGTASL